MANFQAAYDFMIVNECLRYGQPDCVWYTNTPGDKGGPTAWGITEETARANGYDGPMDEMPESVAKMIYESHYWRYGGIIDQRVASKLFDMDVNMDDGKGPGKDRPVRFAQMLCQPNNPAFCDGQYGPNTEAAINDFDTTSMLVGLAAMSCAYYRRLAANDPTQTKFLNGWLARANRLPRE